MLQPNYYYEPFFLLNPSVAAVLREVNINFCILMSGKTLLNTPVEESEFSYVFSLWTRQISVWSNISGLLKAIFFQKAK